MIRALRSTMLAAFTVLGAVTLTAQQAAAPQTAAPPDFQAYKSQSADRRPHRLRRRGARMDTVGKGESEPADKNDTPAGKASNRRVEFIKK